MRITAALGQARLRGADGDWSGAELDAAHAELSRALALSEESGDEMLQSEVLGSLTLSHLLAAEAPATPPHVRIEQLAAALHTARQARDRGRAARGGGESARELTNLAVALLSAKPAAEWGAAAEAAEAAPLLETAVELAAQTEDVQQSVRTHHARSALLEARGDVEAAAEGLERASAMHAAWQPHSREQRRLAIVAAGHHRAGRWAEKLETLKALLAMLPP